MFTIAVDAMGGDNAPYEIIKGCVESFFENENHKILLFGDEKKINEILIKMKYPLDKIEIINSTQVIETAEGPVSAIRNKKNSSMVMAFNCVKENKADAFISAGNTGAILAGGQLIIGRIKGINRTPLASLLPTKKNKPLLMLDLGASVDAKANNILQFAILGSIYMKNYLKIDRLPKVGIVNIGSEEEKGNSLVKESFILLKNCDKINFVGSVETSDILNGNVDVAVCEAFVGNAILKTIESTAKFMLELLKKGFMSSFYSKIGALLSKKSLKKSLKPLDISEYGGAVLLGLKGLVVKAHGNSDYKEIKNAIIQCINYDKNNIKNVIEENFKE